MKKTDKKLHFAKETMRVLDSPSLSRAAGNGPVTTAISCTGGCETYFGCYTTDPECVGTTAITCTCPPTTTAITCTC